MSKESDKSPKDQSDSSIPDNIKPPPAVDLPNPDGLEEPNQQSRVNKANKKRRKKGAKERKHPLDPYDPVKGSRRGCGCAGYLTLFLVSIATAVVVMGWQLREVFVTGRGFEWINVKGQNLSIAPRAETVYLGAKVSYHTPETPVEVVFAGGIWWLSGTFHEKVYFRGVQLNLEPDARLLKGLHADAVIFDPGEAEIEGDVTGRILKWE